MDPFLITVFAFILLLVMIIGGIVTLFPVMRRLGALLELQLEKRRTGSADAVQLQQMQEHLRELHEEIERLGERQDFTEALLESEEEAPRSSRDSSALRS